MKGLESRLVIYLNPVSGVSGGEMEASRPGLLARVASRVAGSRAAAMLGRWQVGLPLAAALTIIGITIGTIFALKDKSTLIKADNPTSNSTTSTPPTTTATTTTARPPLPLNAATKYIPYKSVDAEAEAEADSLEIAFYSLLAVFLAVLLLAALDSWLSGLLQSLRRAWHSLTRGPAEDPRLLHTQPYYLAITRSTCQVRPRGGRLLLPMLKSHKAMRTLAGQSSQPESLVGFS